LATSTPVLERTIRRAKAHTTVLKLRDNVSGTSNDVTRIVSISVKDPGREFSAKLANTIGDELIRLANSNSNSSSSIDTFMNDPALSGLSPGEQAAIRAVASRLFGTASAGHLSVVDPATPAPTPVAPRVSLITIMGVVGGLLIAGLLVFLRASTTTKIDTEEELVDAKKVPVLGTVSTGSRRGGGEEALVVGNGATSPAADAYRLLAAKVGFAQNGVPVRSVLVVDGGDGERSGITAANLAAALAEMDTRVALVDANTGEGEITKLLGLDSAPGYTQVLEEANGQIEPDAVERVAVQQTDELSVLPRGNGDGHQVIELERIRSLLGALQANADMIVINAPSADRSSSALIWARAADATLLVVERRKTKRETLDRALQDLSLADANIIGMVFRS
jgi:polysaccharide biosynthesis transport protein